jgi:colanic acid/amylovoran biosynthesis glycosyltransferase
LGPLPREKVRDQLKWANLFLHAAVSEGFCNAVLEAQAMQLPVVCTDADGLSENINNGQTGFVVRRRDPSALAEKLILLAQDPSSRQVFGLAGRERVVQNFQLAHQLEKFESLYRNIQTQ